MSVVFAHAALGTRDFVAPLPQIAQSVFSFGWLGVDFFFVLSGFIIYYSTSELERTWKSARHYVVQRTVRVYIPYLPISIALVLVYYYGNVGNGRHWSILSSLTLLPSSLPPALSVAWTLQHEIVFYTIFAVGFFFNRLLGVMCCWAVAIVVTSFLIVPIAQPWAIVFDRINLEFLFGMLAAVVFTKGYARNSVIPYIVSATALYAWFIVSADRSNSVLVGLAMAAAVVPIVYQDTLISRKYHKYLLLLGAASYALYLVHNPLISVTSRIAAKIYWLSNPWIALTFSIGASTVVGIAYHLWFERPATRSIKSRMIGTQKPPKASHSVHSTGSL